MSVISFNTIHLEQNMGHGKDVDIPFFSVAMCVYGKDNPDWFDKALCSVIDQTVQPDEIVLVVDGPIPDSIQNVIDKYSKICAEGIGLDNLTKMINFQVVYLKENQGLGKALRKAVATCRYEIIARMDSDDIAYTNRCEKQIAVFNAHPEVSICSGIVEEFTSNPIIVDTKRVPPETNEEIVEFAKKRNPFNHPCVMYKKSAVKAVGSYQDFYLLEDYYLWLRMLMAGYHGYNIQEPLLHMRAGSDMYLRRAGWKYAKTQARLFKFMKQQGFIGEGQYIKSCMIRSGSSLAPNWLRKFMFEKVLRK